jgi:hypothetical protein
MGSGETWNIGRILLFPESGLLERRLEKGGHGYIETKGCFRIVIVETHGTGAGFAISR